jgi:hypothetical protein
MLEGALGSASEPSNLKKCKGRHDRIQQRIFVDGAAYLVAPLKVLFEIIYRLNIFPDQWLVAKMFSVFKRGNKKKLKTFARYQTYVVCPKFLKFNTKDNFKIQFNCNINFIGNEPHGFQKANKK